MLKGFDDYESLAVAQDGRLLRLTLNRPEALNGVGAVMHGELEDFFYRVRKDTSVGAILLTGAGRAFSAGGDTKEMPQEGADPIGAVMRNTKTLFTNMLDVVQPIVCAIQGYAMGVAASIALCADVALAAHDAVIADTHVNIGLVTGDGGAILWPLLMPLNTAKYYLMTGDHITGVEAARLGLVLRSVPAEDLFAEAESIARRLADGPAQAIQGIKATVNKVVRDRATLQLDTGIALEGASFAHPDHAEATAARSGRRPPSFNATTAAP